MSSPKPYVRPRFLKWSLAALAIVLPIGVHALWDAIEVYQVQAAIQRVADSGAPVSAPQLADRLPVAAEQNAAPYYLSAALLLDEYDAAAPARYRPQDQQPDILATWLNNGTVPRMLAEEQAEWTPAKAEALKLLDRATALTFTRLAPATGYTYRVNGLTLLARLAGERTALAAAKGDAVGATSSMLAELGIFGSRERPLAAGSSQPGRQPLMQPFLQGTMLRLGLLLNSVSLDEPALASLAGAFATADEDDGLTWYFNARRATAIDDFRSAFGMASAGNTFLSRFGRNSVSLPQRFLRPWKTRQFRRLLELDAEAVAATRLAWPQRLDALVDVSNRGLGLFTFSYGGPWSSVFFLPAIPINIASTRVARAAIAIERYRIAHGGELPSTLDALVPQYLDAQPIDPYSGKPLHYQHAGANYVVYSEFTNRKDDGGRLWLSRSVRDMETGDLGLRVQRSGEPYPADFRTWTYVKSGPSAARGGDHHIYANDLAMTGYRTGQFPDGAIIVFEIVGPPGADRLTGARRLINTMVKNREKYASTGGWGFDEFQGPSPTPAGVLNDQAKNSCFACHTSQKDRDFVFSGLAK